jgi:hypothetical protein
MLSLWHTTLNSPAVLLAGPHLVLWGSQEIGVALSRALVFKVVQRMGPNGAELMAASLRQISQGRLALPLERTVPAESAGSLIIP